MLWKAGGRTRFPAHESAAASESSSSCSVGHDCGGGGGRLRGHPHLLMPTWAASMLGNQSSGGNQ